MDPGNDVIVSYNTKLKTSGAKIIILGGSVAGSRPISKGLMVSIEFFTISSLYKNANVVKFVLALPFKTKKTDKVCNLER